MDLLIRSQDKSCLRKLRQAIWISYSELDNWYIECDYDSIGKYKTKARALEVLDEIQNILKPIIINKQIKSDGMLADGLSDGVLHTYNVSEIQELSTYVYEMPEE